MYRDGGRLRELHSDDINARFKELVGNEHSAKDFRTWQATVLAAAANSQRRRNSAVREVMTEVAEALGNTPTVARNSYVDPRVIEARRSRPPWAGRGAPTPTTSGRPVSNGPCCVCCAPRYAPAERAARMFTREYAGTRGL